MNPHSPCILIHHASSFTMHPHSPCVLIHHASSFTMLHPHSPCVLIHHASSFIMHPPIVPMPPLIAMHPSQVFGSHAASTHRHPSTWSPCIRFTSPFYWTHASPGGSSSPWNSFHGILPRINWFVFHKPSSCIVAHFVKASKFHICSYN